MPGPEKSGPSGSRFVLASWRKFGVRWAPSERPKFVSFPLIVVGGRVQVWLPEDDHADVGVEVDLPGLGAGKSEKKYFAIL